MDSWRGTFDQRGIHLEATVLNHLTIDMSRPLTDPQADAADGDYGEGRAAAPHPRLA